MLDVDVGPIGFLDRFVEGWIVCLYIFQYICMLVDIFIDPSVHLCSHNNLSLHPYLLQQVNTWVPGVVCFLLLGWAFSYWMYAQTY